jgi:hypothetical protein
VIDVATQQIAGKIDFAIPGVSEESIQPVGIKVTRDGKRAFVARPTASPRLTPPPSR